MRRRTILSCMVLAGVVVVAPADGPTPAAAQAAPPRWEVVAGNFFGDARDEELYYAAGPTPDSVVSRSNGGIVGGDLTEESGSFNITRTLDPITGDFDGDGFDEVFWYAPGTAADSIWNITGFGTATSTPMSVRATYTPLAGDFTGDGVDDIFWYAPGTAADSLWDFNAGGGHTAIAISVRGVYKPFVASIGKDATDDIFWYAPGAAADSLWDFDLGRTTFRSVAIPVSGNYRPIVVDTLGEGFRGDDIWWYAPGTAADSVWDYRNGVRRTYPLGLRGNWIPTVGDFFGDGREDVDLVDLAVGETIRDFALLDGEPVYVDYHFRFATSAAAAVGEASKAAATNATTGQLQPFGSG
jgi:hypothetical protein